MRSNPHAWENPAVIGINREPARCTAIPFPDRRTAVGGEPSPLFYSLNGTWKFKWTARPADRPIDFYEPSYNVEAWDEISVPSNMEIKGYGAPIYRNFGYTYS